MSLPVLEFIALIRASQPELQVKIFTEGSCHHFFNILKAVYPQAEEYYDLNHVVTKIDGKYYDITGEVEGSSYSPIMIFDSPDHRKWMKYHYYGFKGDYRDEET